MRQASAAAFSQAVVPSAPNGKGAVSRTAPGVWADGGDLARATGGKEVDLGDAELSEQAAELVLDDVGQGADDEQGGGRIRRRLRRLRHQSGEAGVFALRKGRLDAAAGIVHDLQGRGILQRQALGRAGQVQLDHFRWTRADQEQELDVGPARQELIDHAVQLLIGVGHAGEVTLLHDGGRESGLGEHHHSGGGLDQVGAGARAHHQEEGVLHLAVKPDDAGQAAEHFPLTALLMKVQGAVRPPAGWRRRSRGDAIGAVKEKMARHLAGAVQAGLVPRRRDALGRRFEPGRAKFK
jgi:hypothetical protein